MKDLTYEQAYEFLSAPSGFRPRIYGSLPDGQIVSITSHHYLEKYRCDRIWLSSTTFADLVRKA